MKIKGAGVGIHVCVCVCGARVRAHAHSDRMVCTPDQNCHRLMASSTNKQTVVISMYIFLNDCAIDEINNQYISGGAEGTEVGFFFSFRELI